MIQQLHVHKDIRRFPRLDTVLMVEQFIQKHDGEYKRKQLWERLPRKMMYQTFRLIIHYLVYSKKVSIDSVGTVGWIPRTNRHIPPELYWRKDEAAL